MKTSSYKIIYLSCLLMISIVGSSYAQDGDGYPGSLVPNVITETDGYSQDFDDVSGGVYPSGWGAWNVGARQQGANPNPRIVGTTTTTIAKLNMGGGANTIIASVYTMTKRIGFKNGTSSDFGIYTALNTEAVPASKRVNVTFDAMVMRNLYDGGDNKVILALALQYRIGTTGDFTTIDETIRNNETQRDTGTEPAVSDNFTFQLPAACSNQEHVQLRWITKFISGPYPATSNDQPSFAIDNFAAYAAEVIPVYPYTLPNEITEDIEYSEDFNSITGGIYPSGWGVWSTGDRQEGANPSANPRITDTTSDIAKLNMGGNAGTTTASVYTFNQRLGFKNGTSSDFAIYTALNTMDMPASKRVNVKFDAMVMRNLYNVTDNNVILALALQYRIGTTGDFTTIDETIRNNETQRDTGTEPAVSQNFSFELPEDCSCKEYVQLRWITKYISGDYPASSNDQPSFAIDNFSAWAALKTSTAAFGQMSEFPSSNIFAYATSSKNSIHLKLNDTDSGPVNVSVYDVMGKTLYTQQLTQEADTTLVLDMGKQIQAGHYVVKVAKNGFTKVARLLVY